jgi:charged multivesicular body protein 7
MKLYESSTVTLRAVLAHPSLQRDKIDETMEAMADATADAQDVDDAIREGGMIVRNEIDEGALEAELKALVEEVESSRTEDTLKKLTSEDMKTPTHPEIVGRVAEAQLVY